MVAADMPRMLGVRSSLTVPERRTHSSRYLAHLARRGEHGRGRLLLEGAIAHPQSRAFPSGCVPVSACTDATTS